MELSFHSRASFEKIDIRYNVVGSVGLIMTLYKARIAEKWINSQNDS